MQKMRKSNKVTLFIQTAFLGKQAITWPFIVVCGKALILSGHLLWRRLKPNVGFMMFAFLQEATLPESILFFIQS